MLEVMQLSVQQLLDLARHRDSGGRHLRFTGLLLGAMCGKKKE